MMLLVDTDVVINAFYDVNLLSFLKNHKPAVCTVVNIEVIQGNKSNEEIRRLEKFIQLHFFQDFKHESRFENGVRIGAPLLKPFRHFAWRRNYRRNRHQPKPSALYLQQAFPLF